MSRRGFDRLRVFFSSLLSPRCAAPGLKADFRVDVRAEAGAYGAVALVRKPYGMLESRLGHIWTGPDMSDRDREKTARVIQSPHTLDLDPVPREGCAFLAHDIDDIDSRAATQGGQEDLHGFEILCGIAAVRIQGESRLVRCAKPVFAQILDTDALQIIGHGSLHGSQWVTAGVDRRLRSSLPSNS